MSEGELQRFIQRFGLDALIDRDSKRYDELGLRHSTTSPGRWVERLMLEPLLLRMPLVRRLGQPPSVTLGADETTWKEWTSSAM